MEREDIKNIMKWTGYVYAPIIILVVAIYLLVQYRLHETTFLSISPSEPIYEQ